uniref:Uncharacterized protein n=1 Tax=Lepeophtheirus salmonis TaxID=72036 RepID=A0A0K2U9X3_LEPSM
MLISCNIPLHFENCPNFVEFIDLLLLLHYQVNGVSK